MIAVLVGMPLEAGEGNKPALVIGGFHGGQIRRPISACVGKAFFMVIYQIGELRIIGGQVRPDGMNRHAGEIKLQARVGERLFQGAVAITQAAMVVDISKIEVELLISIK